MLFISEIFFLAAVSESVNKTESKRDFKFRTSGLDFNPPICNCAHSNKFSSKENILDAEVRMLDAISFVSSLDILSISLSSSSV